MLVLTNKGGSEMQKGKSSFPLKKNNKLKKILCCLPLEFFLFIKALGDSGCLKSHQGSLYQWEYSFFLDII